MPDCVGKTACASDLTYYEQQATSGLCTCSMWLSTATGNSAKFESQFTFFTGSALSDSQNKQQRLTRGTFLQPRPGFQASNVRRDCEYAWECVQQECQKLLVDLLHASATAASNGRSDTSAGAPNLQCLTCCPSTCTLQHATKVLCLKIWSHATATCQPARLLNAWVLGFTQATSAAAHCPVLKCAAGAAVHCSSAAPVCRCELAGFGGGRPQQAHQGASTAHFLF